MLVRTILEKYPDSFFHLMTPGGCVELTPEQVKGLLSGEGVKAHPVTAEYGIGIEAEELLNEKIHYIHWKDGVFGMLTDYLKAGKNRGGTGRAEGTGKSRRMREKAEGTAAVRL